MVKTQTSLINEEFGEIRGVEIEGKPYVVASDVAKTLGYKRPNDAISQHCKYTVKHRIPHPQNINKTLEVNLIPEGDIYRLIIGSKLPSAEKYLKMHSMHFRKLNNLEVNIIDFQKLHNLM